MIYLTPIQITYYLIMILRPSSSKSPPIFMIRSTLQDIYTTTYTLAAVYNRHSLTHTYIITTYGWVRKTQHPAKSSLDPLRSVGTSKQSMRLQKSFSQPLKDLPPTRYKRVNTYNKSLANPYTPSQKHVQILAQS